MISMRTAIKAVKICSDVGIILQCIGLWFLDIYVCVLKLPVPSPRRKEHKAHSPACSFVTLKKPVNDLTVEEVIKLQKEREKFLVVSAGLLPIHCAVVQVCRMKACCPFAGLQFELSHQRFLIMTVTSKLL